MPYVRWLSNKPCRAYRLLTEPERDSAACGGAGPGYGPGASRAQWAQFAWFSNNGEGRAHPVGSRTPNRFGLYVKFGNAAEWTSGCDVSCSFVRSVRGGRFESTNVRKEERS
jgi:sulfatase modifying factor 1